MARLRKFCAYRTLERPYTRYSKYKKQCYVKSRPVCKVVRFDMGDPSKKFEKTLNLISKSSLQIRDNAIESARLASNRILEEVCGKNGFHMKVRLYPHHILRENPLASGAGADRMSTGMAHSFGKTIGVAAQIKKGQPLFTVKVNKQHIAVAKAALTRAKHKIPCSCLITVE